MQPPLRAFRLQALRGIFSSSLEVTSWIHRIHVIQICFLSYGMLSITAHRMETPHECEAYMNIVLKVNFIDLGNGSVIRGFFGSFCPFVVLRRQPR